MPDELIFKIKPGDMTQWLQVFKALEEDENLLPSSHVRWPTTAYKLQGTARALLRHQWVPAHM